MNKGLYIFGVKLSAFLLAVSLSAAVYLTCRDGFKPGLWILSAGLFFALMYFMNLKNK